MRVIGYIEILIKWLCVVKVMEWVVDELMCCYGWIILYISNIDFYY